MNRRGRTWKMWLGIVAVLGGGVYAFVRIGAQIPQGSDPERGSGPSVEDRQRLREAAVSKANLSDEQRLAMDRIGPPPEEFDGMGDYRKRMEEILTPEQAEVMRETMRSAMRERMEENLRVLPEGEREKFEAKLEERRNRGEWGRANAR